MLTAARDRNGEHRVPKALPPVPPQRAIRAVQDSRTCKRCSILFSTCALPYRLSWSTHTETRASTEISQRRLKATRFCAQRRQARFLTRRFNREQPKPVEESPQQAPPRAERPTPPSPAASRFCRPWQPQHHEGARSGWLTAGAGTPGRHPVKQPRQGEASRRSRSSGREPQRDSGAASTGRRDPTLLPPPKSSAPLAKPRRGAGPPPGRRPALPPAHRAAPAPAPALPPREATGAFRAAPRS